MPLTYLEPCLCNAGIAHNKLLAKLASAMNKPNKQTVVPHRSVASIMATLPVKKIRNFGGKVGQVLEELGCKTAADVQKLRAETLVARFGDAKRAECVPAIRPLPSRLFLAPPRHAHCSLLSSLLPTSHGLAHPPLLAVAHKQVSSR